MWINGFGLALPEPPFGSAKDHGRSSDGGTEAREGCVNIKFITRTAV